MTVQNKRLSLIFGTIATMLMVPFIACNLQVKSIGAQGISWLQPYCSPELGWE